MIELSCTSEQNYYSGLHTFAAGVSSHGHLFGIDIGTQAPKPGDGRSW